MRNVFFVLVLTLFIVVAQYIYQDVESEEVGNENVLQYIPANTAVFSGFLSPFPVKDLLFSFSNNYFKSDSKAFNNQSAVSRVSKEERFINLLRQQFLSQLKQPEKVLADFGLANNFEIYFYTFGLKPVLKFQIDKKEKFFNQLDLAENESGFKHQSVTIKDNNYRQYKFEGDDYLHLLIGEHLGWVTITFQLPNENDKQLQQSLSLQRVDNSLASANLLEVIKQNNHFLKENISFLNHKVILKALTDPNANLLGKQLRYLFDHFDFENISQLQSKSCQTEFAHIAENWPMTVFGLTDMSISSASSDITLQLKLESKDQAILSALESIKGFIPSNIGNFDSNIFSVGLGVNTQELTSSLSLIWDNLTTPELDCPLLAKLQSQLDPNMPIMFSITAGMLQGIAGASISIQDYELNHQPATPRIKNMDALISFSSEDPKKILNIAKAFIPKLSTINLNKPDEEVDLSSYVPFVNFNNIKPMLTIKGKNLLIYTGEKSKALANQLASEPLVFNSLYRFSLDNQKMPFSIASFASIFSGNMPKFDNRKKDNKFNLSLNVDNSGIILKSRVKMFAAH